MTWFQKTNDQEQREANSEELWMICPACKGHIFRKRWLSNQKVCPKCNFHDRLTCEERVNLLIDAGTFHECFQDVSTSDPLHFTDAKERYAEKAASAKSKLGMNEAVRSGTGEILGRRVAISVMDFRFLGGSLGSGTGEKILLMANHALEHRLPYIVVSASGGARMHEGIVSLMQMAKTCAGIARLHKAGIPYISILTHPTTGGVSASFAMVGDLNIAEPGALIGFAGRRVIEQTIKQKLPDDFQTAEYLLEHGFIDHIVNRHEMKAFLSNVLAYASQREGVSTAKREMAKRKSASYKPHARKHSSSEHQRV